MTHFSHNLRYSDSSFYDYICTSCGATDQRGSTRLNSPCPFNCRVDSNITSAVDAWYYYGIQPGSCTEYLLRGDYERAIQSAHMLIREDDVWNEHIRYIETAVPECCRGENYDTWKGLEDYKTRQTAKRIAKKMLDKEKGAFEIE